MTITPLARVRDQVERRFEDHDAGPFGSDQSAGDVHPVLWEELIEVFVA